MNVVDALFVTLGLDTSQYTAEQKKANDSLKKFGEEADKRTKDIADGGKKAAAFFSNLKVEILGALAAFGVTTGLKDFIEQNVQGQASLGRLSANLDISAGRLEAWGLVAKEMGGKAEDAFGALQSVAKGVAESQISGHSTLTDLARSWGYQITDNNGKLLDTEHIMLNISKRMAELPRQKAMMLAGQLGLGGFFNQLQLGPEELEARLSAASKLTGATDASTASAMRLQKQWADLQQRFQVVSEHLFARLEPILEKLGMQFANWLDRIDWNKLITQIGAFIGKINDIVKAMGGWKVVAEILVGLIGLKMAAPLLGLIGMMSRLVPWLTASAAGFTSMGAAATGAGAAVLALTAAAALNVQSLGGKERPDGSREDEVARPKMPTFTNADLWNRVLHKDSTYKGSEGQAATLLASRMYVDRMAPEIYRRGAADILAGKIRPGNAGNADPEITTTATGAPGSLPPGTGESYSSTRSRAFGTPEALASALEAKTGVSAKVLLSMFQTESNRGLNLFSKAGAMGPMQIMPATAREQGLNRDSVLDLDYSMAAAARIMEKNLAKYHGDYALATAAYNAGQGNVAKYGGVPPFAETQNYVKKVLAGVAVGPSASGAIASTNPSRGMIDRSTEVNIQTININAPKATDAKGISLAMQSSLRQNSLITGATTGIE